jgi:hypothetical protein
MAFEITQDQAQDQAQDLKTMLKPFFLWMRENNLEKVIMERSVNELKIEFDNPAIFAEWRGGDCPVDDAAMVECKLRGGRVFVSAASDVSWEHRQRESSVDVVGYRVC